MIPLVIVVDITPRSDSESGGVYQSEYILPITVITIILFVMSAFPSGSFSSTKDSILLYIIINQ